MALWFDVQGGPMNLLLKFDAFLLGKCESFSHWLQRVCGLDNFHVAQAVLVSGLFLHYMFQSSGFLTPYYTAGSLVSFVATRRIAKRERRNVLLGVGVRNSMALAGDKRVILLCMIGVHWIATTAVGRDIFLNSIVAQLYFASCTPLPPSVSKVRNFIRSLSRRLVPVPVNPPG